MRDLADAEAALSLRHLQVLALLAERQRTHGELAETLGLSPPATSRLTSRLLDSGHITRTADPDDMRVVQFAATRAGRGLLARIRGGLSLPEAA